MDLHWVSKPVKHHTNCISLFSASNLLGSPARLHVQLCRTLKFQLLQLWREPSPAPSSCTATPAIQAANFIVCKSRQTRKRRKDGKFICLFAFFDFCAKIAKQYRDKTVSFAAEFYRIRKPILLAVSTRISSVAFSVEWTSTNATSIQVELFCGHREERVYSWNTRDFPQWLCAEQV